MVLVSKKRSKLESRKSKGRKEGGAVNGLSGLLQIEGIVEQAGDKSSGQRTDPVNALMRPVRGSKRRHEGACRIQSGTGKRAGDENAERNREANAKTGDGTKRAFFIDGGGEHSEYKKKGCHTFKRDAGPNRKIASELRRAQSDGAPGLVGNDGLQQKCGSGRTSKLRGPVENGVHGAHALGDPEADGHSGIKMSAGDVTHRGNHNADGQTVGEGDAEKSEAAGAVQILIRADRACAEKNQRKRSEELRDQL